MTSSNDFADVIEAYRNGATADMLQADIQGEWGAIWTVAPNSSESMENVGRQFTRMRARQLRHMRRAILKRVSGVREQVAIITELPARRQVIFSLLTASKIDLGRYLVDDALMMLERTFRP